MRATRLSIRTSVSVCLNVCMYVRTYVRELAFELLTSANGSYSKAKHVLSNGHQCRVVKLTPGGAAGARIVYTWDRRACVRASVSSCCVRAPLFLNCRISATFGEQTTKMELRSSLARCRCVKESHRGPISFACMCVVLESRLSTLIHVT
jgi:hypothetical protein